MNLSIKRNNRHNSLRLIFFLLLSPFFIHAQSLSGLWMGTLSNDSTTVRKDESFEIALSEYKGKVMGYSRSTFFVNDTLYYIIKRVRGTIEGDICEVKDDYVISHNFPKKPEKKVKVISTFRRNESDSTWYLSGDWKTTKTKKYYTISGKVALKEEKDYEVSKLFPHLEELKLDNEMPFYAEAKKKAAEKEAIAKSALPVKNPVPAKETPVVTKTANKPVAPPVEKNPVTKPEIVAAEKKPTDVEKAIVKTTKPVIEEKAPIAEETKTTVAAETKTQPAISDPFANSKQQEQPAVKTTTTAPVPKKTELQQPVAIAKIEAQKTIEQPASSSTNNQADVAKRTVPATVVPEKTIAKPEEKKVAPVVSTPPVVEKKEETVIPATVATPAQPVLVTAETKKPVADHAGAATFIAERKTEAPQTISFMNDSLVIALYDNGEVDGDTVSVLLNGEIFWAKQGLKTTSIKKTIYIAPGQEEMTLVLYAENLGKYPPNTGLLMVYDGEERYQVRFSADLNKNAAITFRRKK